MDHTQLEHTDVPITAEAWKRFDKEGNIIEFLKHCINMEREKNKFQSELELLRKTVNE